MDHKKSRPQSIDGFRRGSNANTNRQPVFRRPEREALTGHSRTLTVGPAAHQPAPRQAPKPPQAPQAPKPKVAPTYAIPQHGKESLIGMSMPNPTYAKPLTKIKPKKSKSKSKGRPWSRKRKVVTSVLAVVVVLLGFTGIFGLRLLGSLDKVFHGNIFSDAQALFSNNNLKESNGRVNILLAGDSADDPGHAGADLTDSVMVVSINPQTKTGFMLSIPRDLWVYVPGMNSYQKINAANTVSSFNEPGYPSGGMGQLQQIVQTDLGIPIDYEALINYSAFKDGVNAVGGITIDINSPDPRGLYDKFTNLKLPNGVDTLNGQTALNLARARGDGSAGDVSYGFPDTDFTRTMYQREMGIAILKKATSLGVLSNPLKISSLFSSFSNNVTTNFKLQDALAMAQVTKGMNFSNLGSDTYSNTLSGNTNPLLKSYQINGQDAIAPTAGIGNYAALKAYFQQLTSNNPAVKEGASIELLNGTNVTGLAKTAQQSLQSKGIVNVTVGDASDNYPTNLIVDNSAGKDPATRALLQKMFPGAVVTTDTGSNEAKEASIYTSNFVVIIGQSYANTNQTASNTSGSYTGSSASNTGSNN